MLGSCLSPKPERTAPDGQVGFSLPCHYQSAGEIQPMVIRAEPVEAPSGSGDASWLPPTDKRGPVAAQDAPASIRRGVQ